MAQSPAAVQQVPAWNPGEWNLLQVDDGEFGTTRVRECPAPDREHLKVDDFRCKQVFMLSETNAGKQSVRTIVAEGRGQNARVNHDR